MGKIKVRELGNEALEKKQKQEAKQKGKEKSAGRRMVKGGKGGERIVSVGPTEEELNQLSVPNSQLSDASSSVIGQSDKLTTDKPKSENKKQKTDNRKEKVRSKSYQATAKIVDRNKKYSLDDALALLEKIKRSHFDETVELHINTNESGISGNITLPHGTGKTVRVAIATDELIEEIEKGLPATPSQASGLRGGRGKINFDILVAAPTMMPKLAKVARVLGPKGLMPNPKNGTISPTPEKLVEQFTKGQIRFKTEAKSPIMHLSVGKISFGTKKLSENIQALLDAIKKEKIKNITLKSTMSQGIKLNI